MKLIRLATDRLREIQNEPNKTERERECVWVNKKRERVGFKMWSRK